jgi:hypothetical protein
MELMLSTRNKISIILLFVIILVLVLGNMSGLHISKNDPLPYAVFGVIVGIYFFLKGFGEWSEYNTISNTPTSKVEGIAAGFVEIYGEALAKGNYLISPFCGEECVFYKYTVEEYRSHGKSSSWDIIRMGQSDSPFLVQDETGKIEINPKGAEFEVVDKRQYKLNTGDNTPENIKEFLKSVNLSDNIPLLNLGPIKIGANPRRYTEYTIEKGQKIFVTGTAVPKEGVSSDRHEDMLVIKKGDFNKFFYISDRKEKDVLSDTRNKALLYLIGGGSVCLIGLTYIFFRIGIL